MINHSIQFKTEARPLPTRAAARLHAAALIAVFMLAVSMTSAPPAVPLRPLSHTESTRATPTRFCCSHCSFESHVDYVGRQPPFNRSIVFLEDAFLIRSPMGDASRPLCLGGTCVVWYAAPAGHTTQDTPETRLHAASRTRPHTAQDVNSLEKGIPRFRRLRISTELD